MSRSYLWLQNHILVNGNYLVQVCKYSEQMETSLPAAQTFSREAMGLVTSGSYEVFGSQGEPVFPVLTSGFTPFLSP